MKWLFGDKDKKKPTSQGALDQLTLQQLAKAGGNLAMPTDVVNYLYLPSEQLAQAAAAELREAGYSVEVRPAATGSNWLALARIDLVPSPENIQLLRDRFEALAAKSGGEYDGWEAAVTK
jgi:rhodanese-related sulfurtransferase